MQQSTNLGEWAEQQAKLYLQQQGFSCLASNFHSLYGEIDLIMLKQNLMLFIEVKARSANRLAQACEVISLSKQRKIVKTALIFLQHYSPNMEIDYRFDVICFDLHQKNVKNISYPIDYFSYDLNWIENAFTFDEQLITI